MAATNRDLEAMVTAGTFRGDLYYRLSVFAIRLPPLGERLEDLPLLVDYFVRRFSRELKRDVQTVAPETIDLLAAYPWRGNLRELQSVLKQALLQATGTVLVSEFLPEQVKSRSRAASESSRDLHPGGWDAFINERVHANIQKDGTYSVVPRMWGGVTSAGELRAIADVVDKFRIPTVKR